MLGFTNTMKAIETRYKGYRSRLEARWAVFFDELRVPYSYETEGWQLSSGYYLPDFYLKDANLWVEIKPGKLTAEDIEKCRQLAESKSALLVSGDPWPNEFSITYFYPPDERITGEDRGTCFVFAMSRRCDSLAVVNPDGAAHIFCRDAKCTCGVRYPVEDDARLKKAFEKARGARF
jgi:hypothetical protein